MEIETFHKYLVDNWNKIFILRLLDGTVYVRAKVKMVGEDYLLVTATPAGESSGNLGAAEATVAVAISAIAAVHISSTPVTQ